MRIDLPFTPPYDGRAALRLAGAHAVPGAERLNDDSITRLLPAPDGPVPVTVTFAPRQITAELPDRASVDGLMPLLRHWLDLDLDPAVVEQALNQDPTIGPLITANPGLRRIGYPAAFEAAVLTVLGQQVSLAAGRTFAGRLVHAYGRPGPAGLLAFPSAPELAGTDPDDLQRAVGLTRARTQTVRTVAAAFADDPDLAVAGPQDHARTEQSAATLLALPGIGPWTVSYLRMRLLADPDALPSSDLVLRKALGGISAAEVERRATAWRPWRSYSVLHLWSTMAWA